jgi:hypothetical protein
MDHLGGWPTFHDFEVLSLHLERAIVPAAACDPSKSSSDPGRRQGSAGFLFENVGGLRVDGFNHQNPILGLSIVRSEEDENRLQVDWGGTGMRHEVSFTCGRIAVLRVIDLNPFRSASPRL